MILLLILQIISLFIGSTKVTILLMTLIILGNTININLDTLVKSKNETTNENN